MEVFIESLYEFGNKDQARAIIKEAIRSYQDRLANVSQFSVNEQLEFQKNILNDLQEYRLLVQLPLLFKDKELFERESKIYNEFIGKLKHFMEGEETEEEKDTIQ